MRAEPKPVSLWLESEGIEAADWTVYQVVVDRFRTGRGDWPASGSASARAGGTLRGVTQAIDDGTFERLGVRALWLSPLYDNPEGMFVGSPGVRTRGTMAIGLPRRGPWSRSSVTKPRSTSWCNMHTNGICACFSILAPNHVHEQHPYFAQRTSPELFNGESGDCVCGAPNCPWSTHIETCWFAPYLPDNNGRRDDVARREAADATYWLERFGADGLRIDAVPMMPRAMTRRIVWGARNRLEHPGHSLVLPGETFTGTDGVASIKYQLGPQGLTGQFHFPLMWALREAVAHEAKGLDAVAETFASVAQELSGSGSVLGTMIGNHDVTRFASESDGSAAGDGWTPAPTPSSANVYAKQVFALGLVWTLPGMPVLYYGDELALPGGRDSGTRAGCFPRLPPRCNLQRSRASSSLGGCGNARMHCAVGRCALWWPLRTFGLSLARVSGHAPS